MSLLREGQLNCNEIYLLPKLGKPKSMMTCSTGTAVREQSPIQRQPKSAHSIFSDSVCIPSRTVKALL